MFQCVDSGQLVLTARTGAVVKVNSSVERRHAPSRGRLRESNRWGDAHSGRPRGLPTMRLWHGTLLGVPGVLALGVRSSCETGLLTHYAHPLLKWKWQTPAPCIALSQLEYDLVFSEPFNLGTKLAVPVVTGFALPSGLRTGRSGDDIYTAVLTICVNVRL